jgi:hypothetical protein
LIATTTGMRSLLVPEAMAYKKEPRDTKLREGVVLIVSGRPSAKEPFAPLMFQHCAESLMRASSCRPPPIIPRATRYPNPSMSAAAWMRKPEFNKADLVWFDCVHKIVGRQAEIEVRIVVLPATFVSDAFHLEQHRLLGL